MSTTIYPLAVGQDVRHNLTKDIAPHIHLYRLNTRATRARYSYAQRAIEIGKSTLQLYYIHAARRSNFAAILLASLKLLIDDEARAL